VAREEQRERRRRRRRGIPSFGGEGRFFCEGFPSRTCCKKVGEGFLGRKTLLRNLSIVLRIPFYFVVSKLTDFF